MPQQGSKANLSTHVREEKALKKRTEVQNLPMLRAVSGIHLTVLQVSGLEGLWGPQHSDGGSEQKLSGKDAWWPIRNCLI